MTNIIPALHFSNGKIYVAPNPKGKTVRRAMELLEEYSAEKVVERDVDYLAQFLVDLYGNKFEINDIYGGIAPGDVLTKIFACVQAVVKMFIETSKKQPRGNQTAANAPVTSLDALNALYREIMKQGWTLYDLDESDFFALMELLIKPEEVHYIDELF